MTRREGGVVFDIEKGGEHKKRKLDPGRQIRDDNYFWDMNYGRDDAAEGSTRQRM